MWAENKMTDIPTPIVNDTDQEPVLCRDRVESVLSGFFDSIKAMLYIIRMPYLWCGPERNPGWRSLRPGFLFQ